MRLDLGISSYENGAALEKTLTAIRATCRSDWRCLVVDNASQDPEVPQVIARHAHEEPRIIPRFLPQNTGYAGAVNTILEWAETDRIAYLDHDVEMLTTAWDLALMQTLDAFHEIGLIGPCTYIHFPIRRDNYTEALWIVGCAWMIARQAAADIRDWLVTKPTKGNQYMDEGIGHQNECDMQLRLRLAGWKIAAHRDVHCRHMEHASNNPASQDRINAGVVDFVNKWVAYFCGKNMNYHSENVLRWEDWPPSALYMEQWYKQKLPGTNVEPESFSLEGREYDWIRVPRLKHFYRGRIV